MSRRNVAGPVMCERAAMRAPVHFVTLLSKNALCTVLPSGNNTTLNPEARVEHENESHLY